LRSHDSELGGSIVGSIARLEGLGTDDVADGERTRDNSGSKGTLGGASTVGNSPLEAPLDQLGYIHSGIDARPSLNLRCRKLAAGQQPR
jgi:hypothetical protein